MWHFEGRPVAEGVGDRVCVWCAKCGCLVKELKILQLLVIGSAAVEKFDLPLVSMLRRRAEA